MNTVEHELPRTRTSAVVATRLPRWKRCIDIAGCLLALPVLGVAMVLISLIIRPVFFRQTRVGYLGRRFTCLKFRTMRVAADPGLHQAHLATVISNKGPMHKLDSRGDTRLIPGGWLLRASGFDELPQILNVLRGEMSLVGPRPCVPYEFEQFPPTSRFDALPGLTGLWQVSGKNETTFEEMISLDEKYVRELSLWLDLKIILLTIPTLVSQVVQAVHRAKVAAKTRKILSSMAAPVARATDAQLKNGWSWLSRKAWERPSYSVSASVSSEK